MPSLIPDHKFLLDENVPRKLFTTLKKLDHNVNLTSKGISDSKVALISKTEKRILVTNDTDFSEYPKEKVFGVILLRVPQNDVHSLLASFQKLIQSIKSLEGKLIILTEKGWQEFPLITVIEVS